MSIRLVFLLALLGPGPGPSVAEAAMHRVPVVLKARTLQTASRYPVQSYGLFRTGPKGHARPVPFQIDEVNRHGDYVLTHGPTPNTRSGNGIFDGEDELVFMGSDAGPVQSPTHWSGPPPLSLFEIRLQGPATASQGAVYLGIWFSNQPAPSPDRYVIFNARKGRVSTSRYLYEFDNDNHLVVRRVSRREPKKPLPQPLLESSTFVLKADLKYFLTLWANHRTVGSELEAWKSGPVRTVVRVNFYYTILKLDFEMGMYTEISFFSNAVHLPAVLYNPLKGEDNYNEGSGFYYGFTLTESLNQYELLTNMPGWQAGSGGLSGLFRRREKSQPVYWASATGRDHMVYLRITLSPELQKRGVFPRLYRNNRSRQELLEIDNDRITPISESRVNLGLYFDLTRFGEGEQEMAVQLYFENHVDRKMLEEVKSLQDWHYSVRRLPKAG